MKYIFILTILFFGLCSTVNAQMNDTCEDATHISTECFTVDMTGACPYSMTPPPSCGSVLYEDVWFTLTIGPTGTVTIMWDLIFNGGFPILEIRSGICGNNAEIACHEFDFGNPSFTFSETANTTVIIRASQSGGGTSMITNFCITGNVLPLNLVAFEATKVDERQVELSGIYNDAIGVSHIETQHATDGKDFDAIGRIDVTNGSGEKIFSWTDTNPVIGDNYYRLKIVDHNGTFEYSDVKVVHISPAETTTVRVFPNPVAHTLHIEGVQPETAVQLLNSNGQQVFFGKGTKEIEMTTRSPGNYILRVGDDTHRVMKFQ